MNTSGRGHLWIIPKSEAFWQAAAFLHTLDGSISIAMAEPSSAAPLRYRFEDFEFRERTGELFRSGRDLHLPDQAGKVLLALLRASGEIVTREELKAILWPDKVCGDFESGLNAAVRKLRRALDDDGTESRFVGTLPKRGYRLLVPSQSQEDRSDLRSGEASGRHPVMAVKRWLLWCMAAMLLALGGWGLVSWRPWLANPHADRIVYLPGGVRLDLVYLPPGEFLMGFDTGYRPAEPVHRVRLTRGFWVARTEVTQAQWRAVMGNNPSFFQGDDKPVERVSWDDCQAFLGRLNQIESNLSFRLPTEAEWEYAARASRLSSLYEPGEAYSWNPDNSLEQTHPVARKDPNPWGLYDMLGNVWEWCGDGFGPYVPYPQVDPLGPSTSLRTARGGSWATPASPKGIRKMTNVVTLRYGHPADHSASDVGFRPVALPGRP